MRNLLICLFLLFQGLSTFASNTQPAVNAADLRLTWEVVQPYYQLPGAPPNRTYTLIALTLANNGKTDLPVSGWKMYFNSDGTYIDNARSNNASIERVNGDLFRFTPSGSFTGIKAGQSVRFEFADVREITNKADAPEGFYVVWDDQQDKGFSIGQFLIKPYNPNASGDNKHGWMTPERLYHQNEIVKDIPAEKLTKIFPTPTSYQEKAGVFKLNYRVDFARTTGFSNEAALLRQQLEELLGRKIVGGGSAKICFFKQTDLPAEGYRLVVKPDSINVYAASSAGAFYAVESVKSLIPPSAWAKRLPVIAVPDVQVTDEPRFAWRAVMLDVARNFQSKEQVLKLIDAMALYKLNVLHLHLDDDEGWRLEIPELPELTAVGSKRAHTLDNRNWLQPSLGSGPDLNNPFGTGYYSKADYIDILRYAYVRHIIVIPEIETPGHARAAIKAMDNRYYRLLKAGNEAEARKYMLHDPNDHSQYTSAQNWNDNVIDVSMPSVYNFIDVIANSIINTYKEAGVPLRTIHFGGDEVPAHVWELSGAFQALKATHPEITSTNDLWYYYYGKVNDIIKSHGLYLSGWEEMALRKVTADGRTMYVPNQQFANEHMQAEVWNNGLGTTNEDLAYRLANAGYKVVLSCATNLYFDMAYYKSFDEEGLYWENFTDLDRAFSFIPFDYLKNLRDEHGNLSRRSAAGQNVSLTTEGRNNIVGLQGALWSETINAPGRMEYMMMPRMLALAERAWTREQAWKTEKDTTRSRQLYDEAWINFVNVLGKRELPRLDYFKGGFNYRVPKPGVVAADGKIRVNMDIPGFKLRYTTNGTEPTTQSPLYTEPVPQGGNFKVRAFNSKDRGGNTAGL